MVLVGLLPPSTTIRQEKGSSAQAQYRSQDPTSVADLTSRSGSLALCPVEARVDVPLGTERELNENTTKSWMGLDGRGGRLNALAGSKLYNDLVLRSILFQVWRLWVQL